MSWRLFVTATLVSGFIVGCGDDKPKKNAEAAKEMKEAVEVKPVEIPKVVEVEKMVTEKVAETKAAAEEKIAETKATAEEKIAETKATAEEKIADVSETVPKLLNMDMASFKSELPKLDVPLLKATGEKLRSMINEQVAKITDVTAQLKKLSITELMGETAAKLKKQLSDLGSVNKDYTERFNAVASQLKSMGVMLPKL